MTDVVLHRPVLLAEVLAALAPMQGSIIVDATFGAGGYSRAILAAASCRVIGLDRDPSAYARAQALASEEPRFQAAHVSFGALDQELERRGIGRIDGLVLDLGVSSMQLDQAERGFSFQSDGPLDMRMDTGAGASAAEVVNAMGEADLARILWRLGEEPASRRIARAIVQRRAERPFERTLDLADLIARTAPNPASRIHPATRAFQALRMHVNDELGELEAVLEAAERRLAPGGRLVVVSFHSLEDRMVKRFLTGRSTRAPRPSRHVPIEAAPAPAASFRLLRKGAIQPGEAELRANPRARSARLRAAEMLPAGEHQDGHPTGGLAA
ncbi:16S rRNA (cytosine(1402)-N(4))-methyltransferase RsmH [Marinivivus vitaminiproducens]|uniref:16S rRNA (cytosine(1402)-N(4))-methyltransferase RsmH n=1 Tax=Marinivivus vitaminiproducens TaxID=3035935 RepID=UPI002797D3FB|nr:16S rRNA (cytosine(1402)-N(4))-methyltransferase RsmH [Geminicoccaceae bacterium SCSIO 64248]